MDSKEIAVPDYAGLLNAIHPGFFEEPFIRALPAGKIYEEMILDVRAFDPAAFSLPVPQNATFGFWQGDRAALLAAVAAVDADWPQFFSADAKVYCGFVNGQIASFCIMEDMGTHGFAGRAARFGGPGCVGTLPAYRRQGIGLRMVCDVTALLRDAGCDYSYIHYTGVAPWYARLGYRTCLRWSCAGPLTENGTAAGI